LRDHGAWRHRGDQHRLIALKGQRIAGYCAVIPSSVSLRDRVMTALWWVDLYVHPDFRGQGIQKRFDQVVNETADVKLGVPNQLAMKVHRKHGWGVRDDYRIMLLPLVPKEILQVRMAQGPRGAALRSAVRLASPVAWLWRRRLKGCEPAWAQMVERPEAESLAAIFHLYRRIFVTTNRDADFIRWRYLESPHRSQYTFFTGGAGQNPSLALITRTFTRQGVTVARILDIFGDLTDGKGLLDVLRLAIREAAKKGASQVTAWACNPTMMSALRSSMFILSAPARFCWLSGGKEVMRIIDETPCHWTLADSDNDTPD
jgi:hypothetical protein